MTTLEQHTKAAEAELLDEHVQDNLQEVAEDAEPAKEEEAAAYLPELVDDLERLRLDEEGAEAEPIGLRELKTINEHLKLEEYKVENKKLRETNESLTAEILDLKRQVKALTLEAAAAAAPVAKQGPTIRKKEREYLGMFSFRSGDENAITKQLVIDLKPRTAVTLLPGLPAYIAFMCVRHTDYINDEEKVKNLLFSFNNAVKKVIRKRHEDFETSALWLANTLRLLNIMKQYSGDQMFQGNNTQKQNEQCLRNFDLSKFRELFSDTASWIYEGLIVNIKANIKQLIVPALLINDEIPDESFNANEKYRALLLQELTNNYKIMMDYGVDLEVISQTFKQVFYFICASSLNKLLQCKGSWHWIMGCQIRHNLSHLEMWTKEKNLDEKLINQTLQPVIQAADLLQARRSDEDVDRICDMCSALSPLQIRKILNQYTILEKYEQPVSASFIEKVQAKLQHREDAQPQQIFLLDEMHLFAVKFAFNPSSICLEDIKVPESLGLRLLEKV